MTPARPVVVAVPARDEAARLPAALDAIRVAARSVAGRRVIVVVAADACTDATAALARAAGVIVVETAFANVGRARHAAITAGLAAADRRAADASIAEAPMGAAWIACTDADSEVPPEWLAVHLAAEARGVDVLLGAVRPSVDELGGERFARWLRRNPPAERHRSVHGANLGIRAAVYTAVGGFPPLEVHEDVALVERASRAGFVVDSTDRASVLTSGRFEGRTPAGFAAYLRCETLSDG